MASVFLSYSRGDVAIVQQLQQDLKANDVSVWFAQDKIYGEQGWPKILEEAIAKQDFFLLVWSKNAKQVQTEIEWNIALALKMIVVAYLIDDTPLPESLRSARTVPRGDNDISSVLASLETEAMRKAELLDHIIATEISDVLQQAKAIFGLEALVERMKVENRDDLFVIGAGERRITLYSQQVRALNLVYWLWRRNNEDLTKKHIMVVGAGAAGLTTAAAAAHLGARVTILEGNERPMAFQLGCRTRLLHPHFYEWPERFCWKMSAGLPILDWDEGSAGEVAETIRKQFDVIRQATRGRIELPDSVSSISIEPLADTQDKPVIRWKETGISKQSDHDVTELVLAVGFGVEKTVPSLPLLSYWRDDPLEQAAFLQEEQMHHQLIAGNGDGALIDLLRASLWDFDHANFFSGFAARVRGSDLEKEVRARERDFFQKVQRGEEVSSQLESFYKNLEKVDGDTIEKIDNLLVAQLRKGTNYNVIWLHRDTICWKPDSMPLNRFLVSRLLRLPFTPLKTECGELLAVKPCQSKGFNYYACIRKPDGTVLKQPVHGVTVRIGVEPALQKLQSIWKKLSEEQRGKKPFKYRLPDERLTPEKFWQYDGDSGTLFDFLLRESCKSNLPTGSELCVKLAPDEDENPIPEKTQKGQRLIYRLIVHLRCIPAEVRRVTYDLHPPLGREECDAEEPRKERSVVLEPQSLWEKCEDKELFKKLVHTESDYTVRVRLDNGEEFIDRLACGLCRHYQSHSGDPEDKLEAKKAVRQLLRGHPCQGRNSSAIAHCLLSTDNRMPPD